MANILQRFIAAEKLDERQAMNHLQGAGVVSDNAIHAADVADEDYLAARRCLVQLRPCAICGQPVFACGC